MHESINNLRGILEYAPDRRGYGATMVWNMPRCMCWQSATRADRWPVILI